MIHRIPDGDASPKEATATDMSFGFYSSLAFCVPTRLLLPPSQNKCNSRIQNLSHTIGDALMHACVLMPRPNLGRTRGMLGDYGGCGSGRIPSELCMSLFQVLSRRE
jgi:hypothetical protein